MAVSLDFNFDAEVREYKERMKGSIEMIDYTDSLEDQEGGRIDFRQNQIVVNYFRDRNVFGISLTMGCHKTSDIDGTLDVEQWCARNDPEEIASTFIWWFNPDKAYYVTDSAKWSKSNVLYFEMDNSNKRLSKEKILKWLLGDALEDDVYESSGIGDFWIVPASEFK